MTPQSNQYRKDDKEPHLFLRSLKSGAKSWVYRRTFKGKACFLTSGLNPDAHPVTEARSWVKRINANLELGNEVEGLDFTTGDREDAKLGITLGEAFKRYATEHTRKNRKGEVLSLSDRSKKQILGLIAPGITADQSRAAFGNAKKARKPGPLFEFANTKLKDLGAKELLDWYKDYSNKAPIRSASDAAWLKAALSSSKFPIAKNIFVKGHESYVTLNKSSSDEGRLWRSGLPEFWTQLNGLKKQYRDAVNYIKFLLLTAKRSEEPLRPTVSDFNPKMKTLTIRKMKSRTPHVIYLSRQALEIIQEQCAGRNPTEKIFQVNEGRVVLTQINKELGREGEYAYRPKDMRKCSASIARYKNIPSHLVQAMLDHSQTSTMDRHYSVDPESVAEAWQTLASLVEEIADQTTTMKGNEDEN